VIQGKTVHFWETKQDAIIGDGYDRPIILFFWINELPDRCYKMNNSGNQEGQACGWPIEAQ
jgi:hypothetical protein